MPIRREMILLNHTSIHQTWLSNHTKINATLPAQTNTLVPTQPFLVSFHSYWSKLTHPTSTFDLFIQINRALCDAIYFSTPILHPRHSHLPLLSSSHVMWIERDPTPRRSTSLQPKRPHLNQFCRLLFPRSGSPPAHHIPNKLPRWHLLSCQTSV